MNRKLFASVMAALSLANGVPALIAPAPMASFYGVTLDSHSVLAAQLVAASYIGYAVINWTTSGCTEVGLCRGLDAGNFVAWALGAVIWIYAVSTGMTNALGWFAAGVTVLVTLGWAYFLVADRSIGSRVVAAAPGGR